MLVLAAACRPLTAGYSPNRAVDVLHASLDVANHNNRLYHIKQGMQDIHKLCNLASSSVTCQSLQQFAMQCNVPAVQGVNLGWATVCAQTIFCLKGG